MSQPPQDRDRPDWTPWGREPDEPADRTHEEPAGQDGRPAAPGWGPPSPQYGQPSYGQPPHGQQPPDQPHGQQQYGYPSQYGQQQPYGQQPPYGQPGQYPPPQYGQPQYGQPPYGQAPYGHPQYGHPQQYPPPQYGQQPYGQQQYGQFPGQPPAGWGQPAQPAPRRPRRRLALLVGLLALAVLVATALAQGSGLGGTRLDPEAVQRDVAQQFEEAEGVALDLTCDQDMTVEPGRSYQCEGRTAGDERVTVTIRVTDDEGAYTWSDR